MTSIGFPTPLTDEQKTQLQKVYSNLILDKEKQLEYIEKISPLKEAQEIQTSSLYSDSFSRLLFVPRSYHLLVDDLS